MLEEEAKSYNIDVWTPSSSVLADNHQCDRRLPACTSCSGLGAECIPRNQDFNTVSELSHTSVTGYVASLKRRIADLELESLHRKRSRTHSGRAGSCHGHSPMDESLATPRDAMSTTSSRTTDPVNTNRHATEDSSVRATMGAIGFLSRNAMAEPRDNSDDLPRKFSLAEVISGALAIDGRDPSTAMPAPQTPDMSSSLNLGSRDLTLEHIRKFLEWPIIMPYIDEDIFLQQCEGVLAYRTQSHAAQKPPPLHVFNLHMACAIGISVSPTSTHLSFLSSNLHSAALSELPSILRTESALEHIHCMIMLTIYSLFNSSGGSAWHLLGLGIKTCISIGLHRDPDLHSSLRISEANRRRWMFWAVYSFDRMLSLIMDRPLSIQDDDISVQLPAKDDGLSSSMETPHHRLQTLRYLVLYSRLVSSIRSGKQENILLAYSNIIHWRDLPPNVDRQSPSTRHLLYLFEQLSCRALIHLKSSPPQAIVRDDDLWLGNDQDLETDTINASYQFINRSYDLFVKGSFVCSFIDAYDIFQAAVAFVCLTRRRSQDNFAMRRLAEVTEVIGKASTLVTIVASRFPALAAFQQVLLSLSTRNMESDGTTPNTVSWSHFPNIIPLRSQQLIRCTFT
ncbi:fungal-specific transcription factor domain-containing protein [Colletotrichum acutatum]|uniref:Fungal-specific transcription factor domain-containing protein n=1 Tax=Glomerella acutata TaxID=27357 RepID=A0AAD8U9K7_GLOAC|nr:fungal-specific transcription factor domain-containing protein [Colletotrichum acutatum]KAK1704785.1 fungal-specific transcription factor domain-containing protein [Colletotrichum acutatum]